MAAVETIPHTLETQYLRKVINLAEPILKVSGLCTEFRTVDSVVRAVDGVDLELYAGETLGIVGESGCGKSVTALSIMQLLPKGVGRVVEGEILFDGKDMV